ncbi:cytochrome P450 4C1-like [Trichoplusia ni]|uniref:Cytochrome P450 4C1-like n=1 Tax=Trichoplusia ni TaxID=7111 RepID=A0A7E5VMJ7_TRINI|nr:cytochrome P450 4C1-like [Trichoplusia ni]
MWKWEKSVHEFSLKNGGVAEILFGTYSIFVVTDPDDSLTIANSCYSKPSIYDFAKEMYNRGLVTAGESTWKSHRKLLNPSFRQQVLNSLLDIFSEQAETLVSNLEAEVGKHSFDVEPYLISHFINTASQTTLGLKTDDDSVITKHYGPATKGLFEIYLDRFVKPWLHVQCLYKISYLKQKQDALMKIISDISISIIKQRKLEQKQNRALNYEHLSTSDKFKPLLDQLLELADTKDAFTDDEIAEHLNTMVTAAYDTTAKALYFILILLGSHQDVQTRIFQELHEVLGAELAQDRNLNKHDLQGLVYLEAVIKESLRLYPPAPRIARYLNVDVKLKNYVLPAGSTGVISVHSINRHPMWGADADLFRPERWLDPASLPDNPNAFASFSLGRRNCIGKTYAMMALKTTLVHLCRRYHIISLTSNLQILCHALQSPVHGHHISIELRTLCIEGVNQP